MMEIVNDGFESKSYYKELFKQAEVGYNELTRLDSEEVLKYKQLIDRLEYVNNNRSEFKKQTKVIGDALEDVVNFIFEKSSVFTVVKNIRTSSNEIDQLVILNNIGRYFRNTGNLNIKGDYIISECKNYDTTIGVTWVGKLFSLLNYTNSQIGIMFSYKGLSGSGWIDAVGLTKKLFLAKERPEDKIYIIDINIKHYKRILDGKSFLKILEEEMIQISTDTSTSLHISNHELQEEFKEHIGQLE